MAFMQYEILEGDWIVIDGPCGSETIPADLFTDPESLVKTCQMDIDDGEGGVTEALQDYTENKTIYSIELKHGFGARLQAPGYLDATDWTVYETEEEARHEIAEQFNLCPVCMEELDEDYHCGNPDCAEDKS